jgi:hypothetical protein
MFKQVKDTKLGSYLIASQNIKKGELLIKEDPFCHVISDRLLETNCHYCLKFLEKKLRCRKFKKIKKSAKCKFSHYCSVECQKLDWSSHKFVFDLKF